MLLGNMNIVPQVTQYKKTNKHASKCLNMHVHLPFANIRNKKIGLISGSL